MIHPIPPLQNLMSVDKGLWCRNENIIVHSAEFGKTHYLWGQEGLDLKPGLIVSNFRTTTKLTFVKPEILLL